MGAADVLGVTGLGWQELAVGLIVLAAAAWLVRREVLRRRKRACGCEDCPGPKRLAEAARARARRGPG
jgi:hypothetical protein